MASPTVRVQEDAEPTAASPTTPASPGVPASRSVWDGKESLGTGNRLETSHLFCSNVTRSHGEVEGTAAHVILSDRERACRLCQAQSSQLGLLRTAGD